MTLKSFFDKRTANAQDNFGYKAISNCCAMFSTKTKNELADHITSLADKFHSISLLEYSQFAAANKLKIPNNWGREKSRKRLVARIQREKHFFALTSRSSIYGRSDRF